MSTRKTTTKKITVRSKTPKDTVAGCKLIPLHRRPKAFPKAQDNVLPDTYYRVNESDPELLRAMVTIMPDGLYVAWDTCGKCKEVLEFCRCQTGFYHPQSIGWIRATYDHPEWPERKIMDYSAFYDPFMKREAKSSTDTPFVYRAPETPVRTTRARKTASMTVEEIEAIDMAELQKKAEQTAKKTVRAVRKTIKKK